MQQNKVRSKTENWTSLLHRKAKQVLPHLARLLLLSPFFENGFRMCYESTAQQDYINNTWNCGHELAFLYILMNILGQPIGALMVLARYRVKFACSLLTTNLLLQTLAESMILDSTSLIRAASLAASIVLILLDAVCKDRNLYAGGFPLSTKVQPSYAQLSGPLLVLFMMVALPLTTSFPTVALQNLVVTLMWIIIPCEKRVKFGSLAIALTGFAIIMYTQESWRDLSKDLDADFSKFEFFPSVCVVGGLLMIVSMGFGDGNIHERRKRLAKSFTGSQTDLRYNISDGSEMKASKDALRNVRRRRSY